MHQHLLLAINQKLPDLPSSEKKIAEFVLGQPSDVVQLSAEKLAKQALSSSAAVIRFCKSIGYTSFTDFKIDLSQQLAQSGQISLSDIQADESLSTIKNKMLNNTHYFFEETCHYLEDAAVEAAVAILDEAPAIIVHGIGASYLVASDIKQKFRRIGKVVYCSQDAHELAAVMAIVDKTSVYIGVSNSGEKSEGIVLMELAQTLGLHTISLTKAGRNPLSDLAEISLQTADTKDAPLRSGATISLLTQLFAVDIVFYRYMALNVNQYVENLNQSHQATASFEQLIKSNKK